MTVIQAENSLAKSSDKFRTLKKLLIGGSALHPDLENQLQQIDTQVYHSYSMTETLTHIAIRKVNGVEKADNYHALEGVSFSQDKLLLFVFFLCLIVPDKVN